MMMASELRNKKFKANLPGILPPFAKTRSWLERLPVELIYQIFLHALEVNMLRVSSSLARILSKESIYRSLILFAFFHDDEEHLVEQRHFHPTTYRLLSMEEKLRLQEKVLECPWCTLPLLKRYLPILRRLTIVQHWHKDREEEIKMQILSTHSNDDGDDLRPRPASSLPSLDNVAACETYYTSDYASEPYGALERDVSLNGDRSIFNIFVFPNRLLNPVSWKSSININSYDNPKPVEFLKFLRLTLINSLANGSPCSTDHNTLNQGMETAVREQNCEALDLLLSIHIAASEHERAADGNCTFACVPVKLLHLATKQGEGSECMLKLLLKDMAREGKIPRDDDLLTTWALEAKNRSGFARWLLDAMVGDRTEMYNILDDT